MRSMPFGRRFVSCMLVAFLADLLLMGVPALSQDVGWKLVPIPGDKPPARRADQIVYDSARGVIVMFGGKGSSSDANLLDTWEFNGSNWEDKTPWDAMLEPNPAIVVGTHWPEIRRSGALAFDENLGKSVLWGGETPNGNFCPGYIWEWDGLSWSRISPSTSDHPSIRAGHQMVFYPPLQKIIMFGGCDQYGWKNDIWAWDSVAKSWSIISAGDPGGPSPRSSYNMVYNPVNEELLIFGGAFNNTAFNELWSLRLHPAGTISWFPKSISGVPGVSIPGKRLYALMAYSQYLDQVVLFGGGNFLGEQFGDTWVWSDSGLWQNVTESNPGNRFPSVGCYFPPHDSVFLFGGYDSNSGQMLDDTWEYGPPDVVSVQIDIKPGSYPNSINLGSNGVVPVAIFGAASFDVSQIDLLSVTLANANIKLRGNGTLMASFSDVNGDGFLDVVIHITTSALDLSYDEQEAVLEGSMVNGRKFRGKDSVRIVQ